MARAYGSVRQCCHRDNGSCYIYMAPTTSISKISWNAIPACTWRSSESKKSHALKTELKLTLEYSINVL